MHLSLRAGERVYINGAVLRVDRKVSIELLNDATFLLETHVLHADEATTPLRQLYFAVQTILIAPAQADSARDIFRGIQSGILAAVGQPDIRDGIVAATLLVEANRLIEALKLIRGLYRAEAEIIEGLSDGAGEASAEVSGDAVAKTPFKIPLSPRQPSCAGSEHQNLPA